MQFELTIEFVQQLKRDIERGDFDYIISELKELHPADVYHLMLELTDDEALTVLNNFDSEFGAEVIAEFEEEYSEKLLKDFTPTQLASYVNHLESDDAVDILEDLSSEIREEVISLLDDDNAQNINELLRYEDDTAGGLMAKEMIVANINWNVARCIDEIRQQKEKVEMIYSIYVVDDANKLMGRISLKKLILASDLAYVRDIYEQDIVTVFTYEKDENVASIMSKYDLTAIPVVNSNRQLLGRVTVDDIVDVVYEHAEEYQQLMSGISENVEHDEEIWGSARARLPWLLIGMTGGLLAANFISLFEGELAHVPLLASFIPLIMATGGNVGVQSSTIVVQSLANINNLDYSWSARVFKAVLVALINAMVISLVVFTINWLINGQIAFAFAVSVALFSVVVLSSVMGTITPLVLDKMKINPALASGPFITTTNDLLGIGIYFGVAYLLL